MKKLLVVEDDLSAARALVTRLKSEGYETHQVHSQWEALEVVRQEAFDLFLIDLGLPDGDGLSLASQLITLPGLQATPVLFVTGQGDLNCRLEASKLGVSTWLDKPYRPEDLRQAVAAALRLSDPQRQFSPLAPLYGPGASNKSFKVLLIEDDRRLAQALQCRLEHAGYEVITAYSGGAGLKAAVELHPSLIVSDIYMPGGLGLTLFEHLAEHGVGKIPILYLTASKRPGLKDAAFRMGAVDFLEKPCDFPEILRSIRKALFQRN